MVHHILQFFQFDLHISLLFGCHANLCLQIGVLFNGWRLLSTVTRLLWLDTVDFINQILHVLEDALLFFGSVILNWLVKHRHQLWLVNLIEYFSLSSILSLRNVLSLIESLQFQQGVVVVDDAAAGLDATGQRLSSHELRGRAHRVVGLLTEARHLRSVQVTLHSCYLSDRLHRQVDQVLR